jgi:membrane protein YqaA with SNARE-associated domain
MICISIGQGNLIVSNSIFISVLLSATLLPMQSEIVLSTFLLQKPHQMLILIIVASIGNTLGSLVNWWLGLNILKFRQHRYFPITEKKLEKAQKFYQRYGYCSLLMSWVPVVGDPLTLIAGVMREPLWRFMCIVLLAKKQDDIWLLDGL